MNQNKQKPHFDWDSQVFLCPECMAYIDELQDECYECDCLFDWAEWGSSKQEIGNNILNAINTSEEDELRATEFYHK
jgi:hypothetical protein